MLIEKYVLGQHLTEPLASKLPRRLVYEQTTIQGQIGPKPEKTLIHLFDHPGGSIYIHVR